MERALADGRACYTEDVTQAVAPYLMECAMAVRYVIEYTPATEAHFRFLTARQQVIVFDTVDEQLTHQPLVETRNRKPMRPNPLAPWELRIGNLRVYYDVGMTEEQVVSILAVGIKRRNRVYIGGKEFVL